MTAASGRPPQGDRPLVRLSRLEFSYPDGARALGGIDMDVQRGQTIAIVGPSGCGKSTILSLLAGLREPTRGAIEWSDEMRPQPGNVDSTRLSLVFQKDTVLPWLRVGQNVAFGLRYQKNLSRHDIDERVDGLLTLVGLSDAKAMYPYQLSGGMRRRVAFLTAVATQPRLLLLDEPFSSLDEPSRVAIHRDVLSIVAELGTTVVLVTHDMAEAISLADVVYVLTRGPGRVANREVVPFPKKRDVMHLRETPEYQSLYAKLWGELSLQAWGAGTLDERTA
jgi:ABC-type nitrate/sulfonate/bicarbonate transport system ATPase subunit